MQSATSPIDALKRAGINQSHINAFKNFLNTTGASYLPFLGLNKDSVLNELESVERGTSPVNVLSDSPKAVSGNELDSLKASLKELKRK